MLPTGCSLVSWWVEPNTRMGRCIGWTRVICTRRNGAGFRPLCMQTHSKISGTRYTELDYAPIYRAGERTVRTPLIPWRRAASLLSAAGALTLSGIALGYHGFADTRAASPGV